MTVAAATELWSMSAIELADVIQSRRASSQRYREDLCLDAAQAIEERLGSFTPIDPR
jgi:hypothetical protein